MAKRFTYLVVFFLFVSCLLCSAVLAQEEIAELKAKLSVVRAEMLAAESAYKEEQENVKKAAADKLGALKKEFHRTRAGYLEERKTQLDQLKTDYEKTVGPLERREKKLISLIEPRETNNFAKRR